MSLKVPRYWVPFGGEINLFEDGFIPDPGGDWSSKYIPEALPLSKIPERGLILIGEPGLGKTTALRAEYRRVSKELGEEGEERGLAHWVGLGETRDPVQLRDAIFGAEQFERWRRSDDLTLHLFLDSLDEARLKIERVADLLISGLEGVDFSRLVLRLSCRSADRQIELEQTLRQRFGKEQFAIRELAPLSRNDVLRLAEDRSSTPSGRFAKSRSVVQPLAMTPVSLGFLLDALGESGELPRDRAAIYDQGLRQLAREPDEERRAAEPLATA